MRLAWGMSGWRECPCTHHTLHLGDSYPKGAWVIRIMMNSAYFRHSPLWGCSAARLATHLSVSWSLRGYGVPTTYIPQSRSFIFYWPTWEPKYSFLFTNIRVRGSWTWLLPDLDLYPMLPKHLKLFQIEGFYSGFSSVLTGWLWLLL